MCRCLVLPVCIVGRSWVVGLCLARMHCCQVLRTLSCCPDPQTCAGSPLRCLNGKAAKGAPAHQSLGTRSAKLCQHTGNAQCAVVRCGLLSMLVHSVLGPLRFLNRKAATGAPAHQTLRTRSAQLCQHTAPLFQRGLNVGCLSTLAHAVLLAHSKRRSIDASGTCAAHACLL